MYAIIHPIEPFDSTKGAEIAFTWNGNQFNQVRCLIKNQETDSTIYDNIIDTMKSSYPLPPIEELINGAQYVAYITVFDAHDHTESELQDPGTLFKCLTTPEFSLSLNSGDVIRASSFLISLTYSQKEQEPLNYYQITLYSYQKVKLQSSGEIYNTDTLTYLMSGLENGQQYYIRANSLTQSGISLDTGYIPFLVAYEQRQIFSTIEANNLPETGGIELRSNIISTEGVSIKEVTYLDNRYADLRDNAITFEIGYEVSGDNSHVFALNSPVVNSNLVTISSSSDSMKLDCFYREGTFDDSNGKKALIEMTGTANGVNYVVYSNYIDIPTDAQNIIFCINRINNHFDIKAVLVSKTERM